MSGPVCMRMHGLCNFRIGICIRLRADRICAHAPARVHLRHLSIALRLICLSESPEQHEDLLVNVEGLKLGGWPTLFSVIFRGAPYPAKNGDCFFQTAFFCNSC